MMERQERRWVWFFGVFAALATTLPYLIGFAVQGSGWRYTGLLIGSEDGNSYLAKMLIGSSGDWLFRTPYTAFPQTGFFAFFPYILLGKLAAGAGRYEQLTVLFHLFRISGVVAMVWSTYQFIAFFVQPVNLRRWGTALAIFGGGLGFLSLFGLNGLWQGVMKMPLEFYSPETFGFLSVLALPHLAWGRAFLLWGLMHALRDKTRSAVLAGCLWILLGLMQPLTVLSAWAVLAAHRACWAIWILWRKSSGWAEWRKSCWQAAISGAISAPLVVYNILAFQLDPFLRRWQSRNLIPSPPLGDYLLAYGSVLPFVAAGLWVWRKDWNVKRLLPLAWLAAFPVLAYAPYNLQRRLPEGLWVALCILAVVGLSASKTHWNRLLRVGISLAFISTFVLYAGSLMGVANPSTPLFRSLPETQAMEALDQAVQKDAVVLAAYETSTVLPTRAPVHVLIGHGPESLDLEKIQPRVEAFFSSQGTDTDRKALLSENSVSYVFYGPNERTLDDWNPDKSSFLRTIYHQGDYTIYQVEGLSP
jgi:hypothetical protein